MLREDLMLSKPDSVRAVEKVEDLCLNSMTTVLEVVMDVGSNSDLWEREEEEEGIDDIVLFYFGNSLWGSGTHLTRFGWFGFQLLCLLLPMTMRE